MKLKFLLVLIIPCLLVVGFYKVVTNVDLNSEFEVGEVIDSLNGVSVYYNGGVNNVVERNRAPDGYNIGLKYQCVEFVKRYYLEHYNHRMPDTYGHAKDFFDPTVKHAQISPRRALKQFRNNNDIYPEVGDLVVYKPSIFNPYGHVSIVSKIDLASMTLEVIQQNAGPFSESRESYTLENVGSKWEVKNSRIVGWLRTL